MCGSLFTDSVCLGIFCVKHVQHSCAAKVFAHNCLGLFSLLACNFRLFLVMTASARKRGIHRFCTVIVTAAFTSHSRLAWVVIGTASFFFFLQSFVASASM